MAKNPIETIIGNGTVIQGDLKFDGGLHIDGTVVGAVTADPRSEAHLTLSDSGRVEGRIDVPNAVVNGQLDGDLVADRVELAPKARVKGNIAYRNIEMSLGAQVNGQLSVRDQAKVTAIPQPDKAGGSEG